MIKGTTTMSTNETPATTEAAKPARNTFRGYAVFFSCVFALGAGVISSHVNQWQIPMPGVAAEAPNVTPPAIDVATPTVGSTEETASAL